MTHKLLVTENDFSPYIVDFTEPNPLYSEFTGTTFENRKGFLLNDGSRWDSWGIFAQIFFDWKFSLLKHGVIECYNNTDLLEIDRIFRGEFTKDERFIVCDGSRKLFSHIEDVFFYLKRKKEILNETRYMYFVSSEGKQERNISMAYYSGEPITLNDLVLEESLSNKIRVLCQTVFSIEEQRGFDGKLLTRKAGILVYGPPGNGKTSIAKAISNDYNTSLYILDGTITPKGIEEVVEDIERGQKAVIVFEEVDKIVNDSKILGLVQTLLDGVGDMDGVIFVANTNDIRSIPDALINRPGRFSLRAEFNNPNSEDRRIYFSQRVPEESHSLLLDKLVSCTEGFSFDKCREIVARASSLNNIDHLSVVDSFEKSLDDVTKEFGELKERIVGSLI